MSEVLVDSVDEDVSHNPGVIEWFAHLTAMLKDRDSNIAEFSIQGRDLDTGVPFVLRFRVKLDTAQ